MPQFEKGNTASKGRPKGSKNKKDRDVFKKAEELGVDPFEVLLLFAKGDADALGYVGGKVPMDMRLSAAKDACTYLYSKKKAITLSGNISDLPQRSFAFPDPSLIENKEGE